MKNINNLVVLYLLSCSILISQPTINETLRENQNDSISIKEYDSFIHKLYNDSIVIEEYGIIKDGHSHRREGTYIKRTKKGNLIVIGEYQFNKKIGRWTYFYNSGTIKRIVNYSVPFNKALYGLNIMLLHQIGPFLQGNQIEYYPSGKIKQIGNYEIYDSKMKNFQITGRDSETYEEIKVLIEEEYWVPISRKAGKWIEYDKNGKLTKSEKFNIQLNNHTRYLPILPEIGDYDYLKKGYLNGVPY